MFLQMSRDTIIYDFTETKDCAQPTKHLYEVRVERTEHLYVNGCDFNARNSIRGMLMKGIGRPYKLADECSGTYIIS